MRLKYFIFTILFIVGIQAFATPVPASSVFYEALRNKDKEALLSFANAVDKTYKPQYPESESLENRLLMALLVSDIEKIRFFLDKGAGQKINTWLPSLFWAITLSAPIATLELLINNGFDVNYQYQEFEANIWPPGTTALMFFGRTKTAYSMEGAKLLLSNNVNLSLVNIEKLTALMVAVNFENLELTELLISQGANINDVTDEGYNPLICAAVTGNLSMVKLLVKHGANIKHRSIDGRSSLIFAVENGNLSIVKFLVKHGADINQVTNKGNALFYAIGLKKNNEELVQYLIEKGVAMDVVQGTELTPLELAITLNVAEELIYLMLAKGADVNFDNQGCTPLMALIINRDDERLATELLRRGADPNARLIKSFKNGMSCLMFAAYLNRLKVLKLLIKNKVDLNAQDNNGVTALMYAVNKGHREVVKLLLDAGADLSIKSNQGATVLEYAKSINSNLVDLLESYSK